jgi:hypothetical protein
VAVNKVKEIAVDILEASGSEEKKYETLRRLAGTAMNSKLIKRNSDFFTKSKLFSSGPLAEWTVMGSGLTVM